MTTYAVSFTEGRRVVVRCAESVARQAQWLLELLLKLGREKDLLKDGAQIQAGWVILTISDEGKDLVVLGPDFDRDPFRYTTRDLTTLLSIQAEQNDVLNILEVAGEPVTFQDKIVVGQNALQRKRVYLERSADRGVGDSGWYIGPVDDSGDTAELQGLFVYELLQVRPALLSVLALPAGYVVVFDGPNIEAILDERDVDLWADPGKLKPTPPRKGDEP